LTVDQARYLTNFIDVGEYRIALEMIADWLSESDSAVTASERAGAEELSISMGNIDRVMTPLSLCPHPAVVGN
jgi:hypothetical protein